MSPTEKRAMVLNYQECTPDLPSSLSLISFLLSPLPPSLSLPSLFFSLSLSLSCFLKGLPLIIVLVGDKLPYVPVAAWLVILLSAQKLPPVENKEKQRWAVGCEGRPLCVSLTLVSSECCFSASS